MKAYKLLPDGRRQITGFLFAGDFPGLAIGDDYVFSAEAMEPPVICQFRKGPFRLQMKRAEIADHLGLTIETVSRVLTRMKLNGLISTRSPHELVVERPDRMRQHALDEA